MRTTRPVVLNDGGNFVFNSPLWILIFISNLSTDRVFTVFYRFLALDLLLEEDISVDILLIWWMHLLNISVRCRVDTQKYVLAAALFGPLPPSDRDYSCSSQLLVKSLIRRKNILKSEGSSLKTLTACCNFRIIGHFSVWSCGDNSAVSGMVAPSVRGSSKMPTFDLKISSQE